MQSRTLAQLLFIKYSHHHHHHRHHQGRIKSSVGPRHQSNCKPMFIKLFLNLGNHMMAFS